MPGLEPRPASDRNQGSDVRRATWVAQWLVVGLVLSGCAAEQGAGDPSPTPTTGHAVAEEVTVPAPSLAGNLLGDPTEREVLVVLPPSYSDGDHRYPVVYFLDGYGEDVGLFSSRADDLGAQMQAEGSREFIIVEADGQNSMGGNFYANSPVGGNAADFIAEDLVQFVDSTYRTVADRTARGLAGFSMGGSGAVNLGLSRPDVFGSVYAHSPGLLRPEDGLTKMLEDNGSWPAYAAAFAPDPTADPPARLLDPTVPLEEQDPAVVDAYESGFGNLESKIAAYLEATDRLSEVRLAYGTSDSYVWIPEGTQYFSDLLDASPISHSLRVFDGGHMVDEAFLDADFVDWFSEQLATQP